ncbi:MAG: hypothetical protein MUC38_01355 [Cyclobacteriaceae bacterium]|jgi:hypothetical protein|nr:hypothetical protein [Cyclobacteriaceae bacterium]
MRKRVFVATLCLVALVSCSPQLVLNKSAQFSVLNVQLQISDEVPQAVASTLQTHFNDFVDEFNGGQHKFKIAVAESDSAALTIRFLATRLVTQNQQAAGVLVSALGFALPLLMIGSGADFFLTFWYFPTVQSPIELYLSPEINDSATNPLPQIFSSPGFLRSEERQIQKHGVHFQRFLKYTFNVLENSYGRR